MRIGCLLKKRLLTKIKLYMKTLLGIILFIAGLVLAYHLVILLWPILLVVGAIFVIVSAAIALAKASEGQNPNPF